jgi:DNA-binding response OmpR family regulator
MSKILVVDDEPTIVELIEESLHIEGYETSRAYSGEEALDALAKDPPDLVLLDLMLPGMDGYEVCRQMQKDVRLSQIPVIMLTAKSAVADKVSGYQKGADDYITKPFDTEELLVRVRAQLHHLYHDRVSELTALPGSEAVEAAITRRTAAPNVTDLLRQLDLRAISGSASSQWSDLALYTALQLFQAQGADLAFSITAAGTLAYEVRFASPEAH